MDIYLFSLSIVFGNKIYIEDTTEFASCKILLCDLKFTVSCFTTGLVRVSEESNILGSNRFFKSQNLKPIPLAIVWAVSPE